ncbi:hypothetical protein BJP08_04965 [Corynebacterium sp. NML140438]|uniref:UvrD-helicase domain-containing protein n=1 Tax=Corynebacterium sp. NML140438 TaxID=1906334 RepID=UPI0008FB519C|nr:UvrD-helicase domain-containing protein [Corynebacterium sp. NML140438]OIR42646.1 hypothetical protein BJP08_04965 [Corynebacterium sp. NML140438]
MTLLPDFENRERIRTDVDATLFVEAGAGAGKTYSLVQRLLTLILEREVPVTQIAAITFTKKAAAELSERLARELAKHAGNPVADRALLELPSAAIETLHSFCQRLLCLYPLEAGIPPEITVQDNFAAERQSDMLRRRVSEAFSSALEGVFPIAELSGGKILDADFREALEHFAGENGSMSSLLQLAQYMDDNWGELEPTIAATLPEAFVFDEDAAMRIVGELKRTLDECSDPEDAFALTLGEQVTELQLRIAAGDFTKVGKFRKGNGGRKANWGGTVVKEIKSACERVWDSWNENVERQAARPKAVLRASLALIVLDNTRRRHRTGELQFGDLVYLADQLLKHHPHVREDVHTRFTHLLVDEFQDTDPAQLRIVRAIATDPATGKLTPGALFTVGDPKQSIYRFRHADLDTYLAARDAQDCEVVELTTNFRSTSKVLDWSNQVFSRYFPNAMATSKEPDPNLVPREVAFTALDARPGLDNAPELAGFNSRTSVAHYEAIKEDNLSKEEAECRLILSIIKQALAEDWQRRKKVVRDDGTSYETLVGLEPHDIAILVRTHRQAASLMAFLDAHDVPYVPEGAALTYLAPEIEELHVVLHAAADPAESLSVGAALRTSLLGISDLELAQWAAAGNSLNIYGPRLHDLTGRIPDALNLILKLHDASREMSVGALVSWACDQLNMVELAAARSAFPLEALRRLEFVKHNARAFTEATHGTLREYTAWTDSLANERHQITDPESTTAGGVRILTLHASKGREFPMVILAGMYGGRNNNPQVSRPHPADHVLEYSEFRLASPRSREILEHEKLADAAERARLFYVAATRTRDHLVVCKRTDNPNSVASRAFNTAIENTIAEGAIPEAIAAEDIPVYDYDFKTSATPLTEPNAEGLPHLHASEIAWQSARPRRVASTAVAHARDADVARLGLTRETASLDPALVVAGEARAEHGAAVGTALHAMMERATLDGLTTAGGAADYAAALSRDCCAPAQFRETLASMAEQLLECETVTHAFSSQHYRELPVFGRLSSGGPIIDGVVDLLYRDGDNWVIADYKTDVSADTQTVSEYFDQLQLYAELLDGELDAPITRLELLFPRKQGVLMRTRTME